MPESDKELTMFPNWSIIVVRPARRKIVNLSKTRSYTRDALVRSLNRGPQDLDSPKIHSHDEAIIFASTIQVCWQQEEKEGSGQSRQTLDVQKEVQWKTIQQQEDCAQEACCKKVNSKEEAQGHEDCSQVEKGQQEVVQEGQRKKDWQEEDNSKETQDHKGKHNEEDFLKKEDGSGQRCCS